MSQLEDKIIKRLAKREILDVQELSRAVLKTEKVYFHVKVYGIYHCSHTIQYTFKQLHLGVCTCINIVRSVTDRKIH